MGSQRDPTKLSGWSEHGTDTAYKAQQSAGAAARREAPLC
jgi:hypothetical protein